MAEKYMYQVDASTGEQLNGFIAYIAPKKQNNFKRWVAMSQDENMIVQLASADLGDEARRVFFALLLNLEFENHILMPQSEIAKKIGMDRSHFNRGMKKLINEGIIIRGPKIGRMVSLKLNPNYGWKGQARKHQKALDDVIQTRMAASRITGVVEGGQST